MKLYARLKFKFWLELKFLICSRLNMKLAVKHGKFDIRVSILFINGKILPMCRN